MNALAARRRHPAAIALLLLIALVLVGSVYAAAAPTTATAGAPGADAAQIAEGKKLFVANCSSCHGLNAEGRATGDGNNVAGPPLAGVGAAAAAFQLETGRMPMVAPGVQAPRMAKPKFSGPQISALTAYIASLAPGPAVPAAEMVDPALGNPAIGGDIFRVNCAMCHNSAGAGGALTRGKYAPKLTGVAPAHIYEAMVTGPQSMPVFSDENISPERKRDVIAYLKAVENAPSAGGMRLGSLGPVPEGLFAWTIGLGLMIAAAIWLGKKSA